MAKYKGYIPKTVKKTIKIGKRRYRYYDSHRHKTDAEQQATEQRQRCFSALVRKGRAMSGIPVYRVYIRKNPNCRSKM